MLRGLLAALLVVTMVPSAVTAAPVTRTVTLSLGAASDDAVETNDSSVSLTSGSLDVGRASSSSVRDIGLRFPNSPVPPGAVIQEAHLVLTAYPVNLRDAAATVFRGLKTGNVATFSSSNRPSQIAKTAADAPWSPPAWTSNTTYDSPNLARVVQEIVDQPTWRQGNAIGFAWEDNGSRAYDMRTIYSRDYYQTSARGARLSITYTYDPDPGLDTTPPTVTFTTPQAGASVTGVVPVSASASDNRGIAEVGFYADGSLIGTDTTSPYGSSWDTSPYPEGSHTLTARAVDTSGNASVASVTSVVDRTPPVISGFRVADAGASTVSLEWTTNEAATSRVEYGATDSHGSSTATDVILTTSHRVTVSGLTSLTDYHFRATSTDGAGNASSSSDVATTTALAPVSISTAIAASADDVMERDHSSVTLSGSSLAVGRTSYYIQDIGFRFSSVSIPPDAIIQDAHVTVGAYSSGISGAVSTVLSGLATDNLAAFSSSNRPSQTAKTLARASWSPGSWSSGRRYDSPDLSAIVQEIVDRPGWRQGNALGIAWEDNGSASANVRTIYSRDSSSSRAASLSVTYLYDPRNDVTPPSARITSPGQGAAVSGVVPVTAEASDAGGVAEVGFYADGALIATDTTSPYGCSWNTAGSADGNHTLTARAVDRAGNVSSASVTCSTDRTPPVVSAFRASTVGTSAVSLEWTTNEAATSRVEYGPASSYGSSTATDASLATSHRVAVSGLTPGTDYHFRAVSVDAFGNGSVSSDLTTTTATIVAPPPPPPSGDRQTIMVDLLSPNEDVVELNDSAIAALDGYLDVGRADGSAVTDVGLRFAGVPIPKGALIEEAHLVLTSYGYGVQAGLSSVFRGLRAEDLSAFSGTYRPSQLAKTSASVPWLPPDWTPDTVLPSPDLRAIVQEIVDQPGWAQGGPVGLVWEDAGTPAYQGRFVYSHDFWEGPTRGPRLSVTYAYTPGPDTTPPAVRITSPREGESVSGLVSLIADATDDRAVARVDFYVDGTLVGSDSTLPYAWSWDTGPYATGSHTIAARAFDSAGNGAADSLTCSLYRDTTPPAISNVSVTAGARSAMLSWTTDEPATSIVGYGRESLLGSSTSDPTLVTAHSVLVTGLEPASIYYFRVGSADGSGNSASSMLSSFSTSAAPRVPGPPVAAFSFDDTFGNAYTNAYPVLKNHGFPATEFLITDQVGTGSSLSLSQVRELRDSGWEIGSHTADHAVGSNSSVAEYEASVKRAYDWLDTNGFAGGGFASPNGAWSHDIVRVVRKYHPYLRLANNVNTSHPYDPYAVSTHFLNAQTTIAEVRGWLDQAQANRESVLFSMHGVSDAGFDTRPALLEQVCQELESRRIPVFTVGEILAADRPPDTTIDTWVDSTQQPVLPTIEPPAQMDPTRWNEYWESYFGYPVVEGMSGRTLPTMRFFRSVPNGTYDVYANLDSSKDRQFRYYYSFNDPSNPEAMHVDVRTFEGDGEYYLGTVTVTDGAFSLYTRRIEALTGVDWYGAWGWIKLVR